MPTRRQLRVAELLQRELAELIAYELKDPRLRLVNVTRVEMTADLRMARVYVSHLEGEEAGQEAVSALEHATGLVRRELGQRTKLRYVPELRFLFDEGLIVSQRIDALLQGMDEVIEPPALDEDS